MFENNIFFISEVSLGIFQKSADNKEIPLADFHVLALEASLEQNTYDLKVDIKLGGLSLNQNFKGSKIHVINTPMAEGKEEYLFIVKYFKVSAVNNRMHELIYIFDAVGILSHDSIMTKPRVCLCITRHRFEFLFLILLSIKKYLSIYKHMQ